MGILAWVVLGLMLGLVAKALMPAADPGGIVVTIVLGIVGAVIGGVVAAALGLGGVTGPNPPSLAVAFAGALIFLAAYRLLVLRRGSSWE